MGKILYKDCLAVLPKIPDGRFDLCLTDPPYNIKFKGLKDDDNNLGGRDEGMEYPDDMGEEEYRAFSAAWWKQIKRVARRAVFTIGKQNLAWWLNHDDFDYIAWHNPGGRGGSKVAQIRHWEPLVCYNINSRGGTTKFDFDIFTCSSEFQIFSARPWLKHPTPKPLKLWGWILDCLKPASVIDPFLGSGTTGYACEQRGIPWVGIERDERYKDDIERSVREGKKKRFKTLF